MGLYEERVRRLREHVLRQQKKAESQTPELTNAEIKTKLDELGIEYDKRANKATLLALLESAQNENTGEDPHDGNDPEGSYDDEGAE